MRSLALLLTLTVVFLLGILIGIERDKPDLVNIEAGTNQTDVITDDDIIQNSNDEKPVFVDASSDVSKHFTQKAASFLEAGVKTFYDVIVEVLYQISSFVFS